MGDPTNWYDKLMCNSLFSSHAPRSAMGTDALRARKQLLPSDPDETAKMTLKLLCHAKSRAIL